MRSRRRARTTSSCSAEASSPKRISSASEPRACKASSRQARRSRRSSRGFRRTFVLALEAKTTADRKDQRDREEREAGDGALWLRLELTVLLLVRALLLQVLLLEHRRRCSLAFGVELEGARLHSALVPTVVAAARR